MLSHTDLVALVHREEGRLLERKPDKVNVRQIRQTVVAFANSVNEGEEGVLLIGIADDGEINGCADPDTLQKRVRECCEKECYPAVDCRIEVLHEHKNTIAVVIPLSQRRPHFAGPAYVRKGSESVAASAEMFDELVHSRNSKVAELLRYRREVAIVRVIGMRHHLGQTKSISDRNHREVSECKVIECNAQYVTLQKIASSERFSEPLDHVTVTYDQEKWCPLLVVTGF